MSFNGTNLSRLPLLANRSSFQRSLTNTLAAKFCSDASMSSTSSKYTKNQTVSGCESSDVGDGDVSAAIAVDVKAWQAHRAAQSRILFNGLIFTLPTTLPVLDVERTHCRVIRRERYNTCFSSDYYTLALARLFCLFSLFIRFHFLCGEPTSSQRFAWHHVRVEALSPRK